MAKPLVETTPMSSPSSGGAVGNRPTRLILHNTLTNTIEETRNVTGMDAMERRAVECELIELCGDAENFRVEESE